MYGALVAADNGALPVDEISGLRRVSGAPLDEIGVVAAADKTYILAFRLRGGSQTLVTRYLPDFPFEQSAEGEERQLQLFLRHGIQDIALILGFVHTFTEKKPAGARAVDPGVVPGGYAVISGGPRFFEKPVEFDVPVAIDTWIWGSAGEVFAHEFFDYALLEIAGHIENVMRDSDAVRRGSRILGVMNRTA
jgi:hypothetical protein